MSSNFLLEYLKKGELKPFAWTCEPWLSEELSLKHLGHFLNLAILDNCLISFGHVFHNLLPRKDFEYQENTNLLFCPVFVSWSCEINWLSIL